MSRPVAGVRNKSVIVTLPGSPKGAKENLQAILKTLPHACLQAAGVSSRALHTGGVKKLEVEAGMASREETSSHLDIHSNSSGCGHHHNYHHGQSNSDGHGKLVRHTTNDVHQLSNDPHLGTTRRHRKSPFPMLSVSNALDLIKTHTPAPAVTTAKVSPSLVGSVLAADVCANENVPAFRASIVDGYAVVVPEGGDMRGSFPVVSVSHAAPGEESMQLQIGEVARITTGAPLPKGATSVIMVEDTILKEIASDGKEEKIIEILAMDVKEGENIREVGSDVKMGSVILHRGDTITAVGGELGLLASVGVSEVQVYRKPIIGVLSTGDELVESDMPVPLRYGQVRDTNRPTLLTAARSAGFEALDLGIAIDKSDALETTIRDALRQVDVLVTTGGVSMGELDLLKPTIERSLGGTIHFGRVSMKPGKPTTFATVPVKDILGPASSARHERCIFSLPGNPASALVTFYLFVLPSLHYASGVRPAGCTRVPVFLAHDFPLDPVRTEYHRAIVTFEANPESSLNGSMVATSTGGQRSSTVGSMKSANALLEMPPEMEVEGSNDRKKVLKRGTRVMALLVAGL